MKNQTQNLPKSYHRAAKDLEKIARDIEICERWGRGESAAEIAQSCPIGKRRIYQILSSPQKYHGIQRVLNSVRQVSYF